MTHKKYCQRCQGAGQVDTGIMESPVTVCNECNGTGLAQQRTWVGLNWDDLPEIYVGDVAFLHGAKWAEAKLMEKNT